MRPGRFAAARRVPAGSLPMTMQVRSPTVLYVLLVLVLSAVAAGGKGVRSPAASETSLRLVVPPGFPDVPEPGYNRFSPAKVRLGERLFFDPILSRDGSIACSSCHLPEKAFSDPRRVSLGVGGRAGLRNAPSLVNVAYQKRFFLDGGALTLESQALGPLEDENEMDSNLEDILDRLGTDAGYLEAFGRVFGEVPTLRGLTQALAAFQRTILSGGSRFDQFRAGNSDALSPAQRRGLALFEGRGRCGTCHSGFLLSNLSFQNNGLAATAADSGRARITLRPEDYGKFRVPPLRNVALTAPYMHDGRLATLGEVVDHYDSGGAAARGQHRAIHPLGLTAAEKEDLVAFLNSLNDVTIYAGLDS